MIDPECHLWGETFSPARLREIVPEIEMRRVTEPGDIQTRGRYRGQPARYGACCITTPRETDISQRIEWMADFMALNMPSFKEAGASDVIYWLYWTGVQGNIEFRPSEIRKIAALDVSFCINYIQESEEDGEVAA